MVLDLCCGSGCIGIATAHYYPDVTVDLVDISADALAVAKKNIDRYHLQDRVQTIQSDLFENMPIKKYDLILTNPPYVDANDMENLPMEYRHEPQLALTGGSDGLDLVRKILRSASAWLNPGGVLILEVGNSEFALQEAYPNVPFVWLEFENAEGGVCAIRQEELKHYQQEW